MHVLILTLGKGGFDQPVTQGFPRRYRTATYRFADGTVTAPTSFFGLALLDSLRQHRKPIDRLLVIGTMRSMWDAWLELPAIEQAAGDGVTVLYNSLADAVSSGTITAQLLESLATAMTKALELPVDLRVIPEAETRDTQAEVLDILARNVPARARITLDVTHGLRHLPMLQLLSSFHLQLTRGCVVDALYYAALELAPRFGCECPVIRLDFGNEIFAWLRAVTLADGKLDFNGVADCLPRSSDLAPSLRLATWHIGLGQVDAATAPSVKALKLLKSEMEFGIGSLFRDKLRGLLAWAEGFSLAERQLALAQRFLEVRDYLRAAMLLQEAFISHHVTDPRRAAIFGHREPALQEIRRRQNLVSQRGIDMVWEEPWVDAYGAIGAIAALRNAMAHGTQPENPRYARMLNGSEQALLDQMQKWAAYIRKCVAMAVPDCPTP